MRANSDRMHIRRLELDDLHILLDLRARDREFLRPFEPVTSDTHYTVSGQQQLLEKVQIDWTSGSGYGFGIFLNGTRQWIGRINLSNVVRGAWESCTPMLSG